MRSGGRSALLGGMLLVLSVAVASGAEPPAGNDSQRANSVPGVWEKAERGLSNVTVGFVIEVPKTVAHESEAHGPLFGATVGLIKGMGLGVGRTLVGVYELVTFPTPNGVVGYAPVLEPGTPFSFERTSQFLDTPIR